MQMFIIVYAESGERVQQIVKAQTESEAVDMVVEALGLNRCFVWSIDEWERLAKVVRDKEAEFPIGGMLRIGEDGEPVDEEE